MYTCHDLVDGALIWCEEDSGTVRFRRSRLGHWFINETKYSFEFWLELVDLTDEEKVMLKLRFG